MRHPEKGMSLHQLPTLPYHQSALEPYVDAQTMMLHHGKHHASYVANLNAALEAFPQLQQRDALWLLLNLDKVPRKIRLAVRNNAGGHVNHSLFWLAMSPAANSNPEGPLADAIKCDFGGFEQFQLKFVETGEKLFGSGWVWLVRAQQDGGRLQIHTTTGHDNPMTQGHFPILLNDVWEHAYYLKYESRRVDYLNNWWAITDWEEAARRFDQSDHSAENDWEDEGGQ
jgi:Fe-Mn family superoxide dismutase